MKILECDRCEGTGKELYMFAIPLSYEEMKSPKISLIGKYSSSGREITNQTCRKCGGCGLYEYPL